MHGDRFYINLYLRQSCSPASRSRSTTFVHHNRMYDMSIQNKLNFALLLAKKYWSYWSYQSYSVFRPLGTVWNMTRQQKYLE